MEIDQVQPSDLDAIARLHAHFWGETSDVDAMAETLARLDQDPDHVLLAARIEGECIGTATGVICRGLYGGADAYLVIEDVVVDPHHRRRGVATALLTELERYALSCSRLRVSRDDSWENRPRERIGETREAISWSSQK